MSGQGHPESADIAGLPAEYIVRQMNYFKSGARKDNERMGPIAKNVSDEDVRQAADYFAAIKPIPWVKVIETATPPKTYVSSDGAPSSFWIRTAARSLSAIASSKHR